MDWGYIRNSSTEQSSFRVARESKEKWDLEDRIKIWLFMKFLILAKYLRASCKTHITPWG
jgi:hypothetical protein